MTSQPVSLSLQHLVNIPRQDNPNFIAPFIGKWFKIYFKLPNNCINGSYQVILGDLHQTEIVYSESSKVFYSCFYLPYESLTDISLKVIFNDKETDRHMILNINDVLPTTPTLPLDYTQQFSTQYEVEMSKTKSILLSCYFTLHLMNYSPLSWFSFDLITDLKQQSRLAMFDKNHYVRIFVYATSIQYQDFIKNNQQLITAPESLQSFQEKGFLLYITQLTEEQTKSASFPFIEFDSSLLQYVNAPNETLKLLSQEKLPSVLPMSIYNNAVYLRFEIRNDSDQILAVAQESIPILLQPFCSMQRTAARELAPITVGTIGSNRLYQQLIHNHHVLNKHEKLDEPSVSHYKRSSRNGSKKSSTHKSRLELEEPRWNPPQNQSEQTQARVLKQPSINPVIPTVLLEDINERDKTIQLNRAVKQQIEQREDDGLKRLRSGPVDLPLYELFPPLYNSSDPNNGKFKVKTRGSLYVLAMAHYHLPTMKEAFLKNNIILKPSVVLDYYSDPFDKKNEIDKCVDIMENVLNRLEQFFTYRRVPHVQREVDHFFSEHYSQFGKPKLIDPEAEIDKVELQRDFEPGEPYILRSIEPSGIPLTLLNITPPPHLTPVRDLSSLPQFDKKFSQLLPLITAKFPYKTELQRYLFNNYMKGGNNAYPTPNSPCPGINRRGIVSSDNRFHRQIFRDNTPTDEYSCDIFDSRRLHPLLDLNLPQISPYCDYPLSVEQVIYYCRTLRMRLKSSILQLPEDYEKRRQNRLNGKIRSNDNNSGVGGQTTAVYIQEFAKELIIRTLMDVELKIYKTNMIEYHVVFVGGYRGSISSKSSIQKYLREYLSMLPVSFIFIEFDEKTVQREKEGAEHTNGGALLDNEGLHLVNETGMFTTQAPKYYAVQAHETLALPTYTYDRRNLKKLQHEYLYPQRDNVIGMRKSWFLDKDTKVYEYDKVAVIIKQRLAIQIKQFLDIQFKSRCTFETMAQILYPSPPGVMNPFSVQCSGNYTTQCAFYKHFFAAADNNNNNNNNNNDDDNNTSTTSVSSSSSSSSPSSKSINIGDEKRAHQVPTFEQEELLKAQNRCPCCQVYDTTVPEAIDILFSQTKQSSQFVDAENNAKFARFNQVEFIAGTTQDDETNSNISSLVGSTKIDIAPPPFMDDIVDTSKFNIKLSHISTPASVRDTCDMMQFHIEQLSKQIAIFKETQGL